MLAPTNVTKKAFVQKLVNYKLHFFHQASMSRINWLKFSLRFYFSVELESSFDES